MKNRWQVRSSTVRLGKLPAARGGKLLSASREASCTWLPRAGQGTRLGSVSCIVSLRFEGLARSRITRFRGRGSGPGTRSETQPQRNPKPVSSDGRPQVSRVSAARSLLALGLQACPKQNTPPSSSQLCFSHTTVSLADLQSA